MATLRAGVARVVVNPPLGVRTAGFSARTHTVERLESDLTASCVVLEVGGDRLAIVALDTLLIALPTMTALRERIAEAVGTTAERVLVNCSHTHSAPAPPGWFPQSPYLERWLPAAEIRLLRECEVRLLAGAVEAARRAAAELQPARIGAGWGESRLGVQRRELGPDGLVFLGEVPAGEIDPAVGVIRVDDLAGEPIAVLTSYGCHTVVVGPRDYSASPDFPGATRDALEAVLGGTALFLQGCGGDIMPRGGMGWESDCRDAMRRAGTALAGAAIEAAADIRTHLRRGERTTLISLSGISLWPWLPVGGDTGTYLGAAEATLALELLPLPPPAEAARRLAECERALDAAFATGGPADIAVATRFADTAARLVAWSRAGRRTLDTVVQAVRVNDLVLVGIAMEVFAGTGLTIKARSPFPLTQVLGYTNGCVAYLPRAQDYPPGGWDIDVRYRVPDMLFQAYGIPVAIHPNSEARVVDCALALIDRLR